MKRISVLVFLMTVLQSIPFAQNSYPAMPSDNAVVSDTSVQFVWNPAQGIAVTYQLQVSTDSLFNSQYLDQSGLLNTQYTVSLVMGQSYWWRVRYAVSGIPQSWSPFRKIITFSPAMIPGLKGWFEGDTGLVTSGNQVQSWQSLTGNLSLGQTTAVKCPVMTDTSLFGSRSLYFDGVNDFLETAFLNYPSSSYILFHNPLNKNSTLVSQARFTFTGYNFYINNVQRPSLNCIQTPSSNGYSFSGYPFPFIIPTNRASIDGLVLKDSGPVIYTGLSDSVSQQTIAYHDLPASTYFRVGAMGNNSAWYKGHLYALLIADTSLLESEYQQLYEYLAWKYQPPVNLGPDKHLTYSFCTTPLQATHHYRNYLWSTGDTTATIAVKDAGVYWLEVTDYLGRISRDTLMVTSQVPVLQLSDTLVCMNTQAFLNSGFSGAYQFIWDQDPLLNLPALATGIPGYHTLVVTDSFNCYLTDSALITLDTYAMGVSLGSSRSVCAGEILSLDTGASTTITYQWSTGINDTLPQISMLTPGFYAVTTTNLTGCIATSQIYVSIKGASPQAAFQFSSPQVCLNDTLHLTDLSLPADPLFPVSNWEWTFGDGNTDTLQNPSHQYLQPGHYLVKLVASTDSGCFAQFEDSIWILPIPTLLITSGARCSGAPVFLSGNPSGPPITVFNWQFQNSTGIPDTSTLPSPAYTWPAPGNYWISLMVTAANGCQVADSAQLLIHLSPSADLTYTPASVCRSDQVTFTDLSTSDPGFPNNYWKWDFGDGTSPVINLNKPVHTYLQAGAFNVSLITGSTSTGCSDTVSDIVAVGELPEAIIQNTPFCSGQVKQLTQSSTIAGDSIVSWIWKSATLGTLSGPSPAVIFQDTGFYPFQLIVTTNKGCSDTASEIFISYPVPVAGFDMTPIYGNPPLVVNFTNQTDFADLYSWDFDDGFSSSQVSPTHTFTQAGTFNVSLMASTLQGCFNTFTSEVFTIKPLFDIEMIKAEAYPANNQVKIIAEVKNNTNVEIHRVELQAWIDGENAVVESWIADGITDRLLPGHILRYEFASKPVISNDGPKEKQIVCVKAYSPEYPVDDNPVNDLQCVAFSDAFYIGDPYPNPARDQVVLDVILEIPDIITVMLFNDQGQQVSGTENKPGEEGLNRLQFAIPDLCAPGVYYFRILYRDQVVNKKLILFH